MNSIGRNLASRYITRPKTRHFGIHYLDLWRETTESDSLIEPTLKAALQKQLVELSLVSRHEIALQSDLNSPCPIEVKLNGKVLLVSPGIEATRNEADKRKFEHGDGIAPVVRSMTKQPLFSYWHFYPTLTGLKDGFIPHNRETAKDLLIAQFIKPLQDAIDSHKEVNQFHSFTD